MIRRRCLPTRNPPGGVDITGVYRDPWGNPYVITMDLNYDEQCQDAFYCSNLVSSMNGDNSNPGWNGLVNPDTTKPNGFSISRQGHGLVRRAGRENRCDDV